MAANSEEAENEMQIKLTNLTKLESITTRT